MPEAAQPFLLGARDALQNGIDRFEVTGVGGHRHLDLRAERGLVDTRGAQVVLDVARALRRRRRPCSPSNSRKIRLYDLPMVLASTLRRPRCAMPMTTSFISSSTAALSRVSSSGMRLSAPSRPKRLWPTYLVWRNRSKASASLSFPEDADLLLAPHAGLRAFDPLLDPRLLLGLLHVHELDADGAAVGVTKLTEDVAQLHDRLAQQSSGGELTVEVPDGEPIGERIELGVHDRTRTVAGDRGRR